MIYLNCAEFCVDFKSLIRNNNFLKAKNFIFFWYANYMQMRGWGVRKNDIFSFGHQMGLCAKNYENLPIRFFMGINGVSQIWMDINSVYFVGYFVGYSIQTCVMCSSHFFHHMSHGHQSYRCCSIQFNLNNLNTLKWNAEIFHGWRYCYAKICV